MCNLKGNYNGLSGIIYFILCYRSGIEINKVYSYNRIIKIVLYV